MIYMLTVIISNCRWIFFIETFVPKSIHITIWICSWQKFCKVLPFLSRYMHSTFTWLSSVSSIYCSICADNTVPLLGTLLYKVLVSDALWDSSQLA